MLVLSRRVGESLVIGDDITITVLEFRGDVIRIGVDAPRHIQVRRQELLVELAETNRAAASPGAGAVAGLSRLVSGAQQAPAERTAPEQPGQSGQPDQSGQPEQSAQRGHSVQRDQPRRPEQRDQPGPRATPRPGPRSTPHPPG